MPRLSSPGCALHKVLLFSHLYVVVISFIFFPWDFLEIFAYELAVIAINYFQFWSMQFLKKHDTQPPPPQKKKKSLFLGICLCSAYLSVGYPGVTFFYCCIGLTYFTKCLCFSACLLCFTYLFTVGIVQYFIGERRHRKTWLKPSCN